MKKEKISEAQIQAAIKDLIVLEKAHGHLVLSRAMRRKLHFDTALLVRENQIKKLEAEVSRLRQGKFLKALPGPVKV